MTTRMTTRGCVRRRRGIAGRIMASLLAWAPAPLWALSLAAAHPVPVEAQTADVSGTWDMSWANAIRRERDGSVTVQRMSPSVLTLEQRGDSIAGTWSHEVGTPVTWTVAGTASPGGVRIAAREILEGTRPGDDGARIAGHDWTARLAGADLEGDHWILIELPSGEIRRSGPRPWSARRRPAPVDRTPEPAPIGQVLPTVNRSPGHERERPSHPVGEPALGARHPLPAPQARHGRAGHAGPGLPG